MRKGYNEIYYDAKRDFIWVKIYTLNGFEVLQHKDAPAAPDSDHIWPSKAKHQVFLGYED